jgi:multidrug efflux pump subunit AcrA (membrane-fusion protein)
MSRMQVAPSSVRLAGVGAAAVAGEEADAAVAAAEAAVAPCASAGGPAAAKTIAAALAAIRNLNTLLGIRAITSSSMRFFCHIRTG